MVGKLKVLCFHPALAPYRVDFFNILAEQVELTAVFLQKDLFTQRFDTQRLLADAKFSVRFLTRGFDVRQRCVRLGLGRLIRKVRPDVIISYEASPTTLILCLMRRFARWQLWTTMDDSPELIKSRTGFRAVLRDWVVCHCDGVIVPSSLAAEAYPCHGHFAAVPIIYDEKKFRRDEAMVFRMASEWRRRNLASGDLMMLFVGRLSPEKNLRWLIEKVADQRWPQNLRLFLVGSGAQEQELRRQIEAAGLGNRVVLLGRKLGLELYSLYAAADLFVLPSVSETFGAVVAEALHWGAKCLVSESVGAKSLITETNGHVFQTLNDEQFFKIEKRAVKNILTWNGFRKSRMSTSLRQCIENLVQCFHKNGVICGRDCFTLTS